MKWNPERPMVPYLGNEMQRYPERSYDYRRVPEWRLLLPFNADLQLASTTRGMSARTFYWRDVATGTVYPMFPSDLLDLIQGATIRQGIASARWRAVKKGQNYGIAAEVSA